MKMHRAFVFSLLLAAGTALAAPKATKLSISTKGEEMLFDKTELTVKPGAKVELTFDNKSSMQHNWVLVKPGTADAVAQASLAAGADKGWLAKGDDVLANTSLVDAKKKETITFTAPAQAGDYPFVCTFPGHAGTMKGVLHVK